MGVAARLTAYALALLLVFGVAWFVGGLVRPLRRTGGTGPADVRTTGTTWAGMGRARVPGARPPVEPPTDRAPRPTAREATGWPSPSPKFVPGTPRRAAGSSCSARTALPRHTGSQAPRATRARCTPSSCAATPRASSAFSPTHWTRTALGAPRCGSPRPGCGGSSSTTTPTGGPDTRARRRPVRERARSTPFTLPALAHRAGEIGGFQLRLDGDLVPGVPSQVFATVTARARASPTCSPTSARSASSSRSARAISPTPPPRRSRRGRPCGPRGRVHGQRPERRDLSPLPPVPRSRCHAHSGVHPADEEPMSNEIDLVIGGMTCASCAGRVERKLNKLDGVVATVNLATEKAHVSYPDGLERPRSSPRSRRRATRPRCPCRRPRRTDRPDPGTAQPLPCRLGAGRAGGRALDGPRAAVPRLGVARARAHRARRGLGRAGRSTARPRSTSATAPPPWTRSSPSARSPRSAGRVVRCCSPARGDDLPRGRRPRSPRSCSPAGGSRPAPSGGPAPRCARCSTSAPRRSPAARRRRASGCRSPSCGWATSSWSAPARRSPPTAWSRTAPRRSTPRCSPASRCRSRSVRATAVVGATINAAGRLLVRATRVGADTQLAQMARLVEEAQSGKAPVQRLADRISAVFVPVVIVLAVATLGAGSCAGGRARRPRSPPRSPC